jgi:hypothetical protein
MEWLYNEAVFDEGIGAGKSYKASIIITYLVYRILILRDPYKFLHLAKGSGIYFMNMSVRAQQASKVVFGEIAQRVNNSPWFKSKNYLPRPDIKSELQFPKSIFVVPGNSKETFPLGFNLLGGVMDEAAFYTETQDHDVAEEIFNALHNRIKNRFGNRGMLVMISSPRYVDDFIEKKMKEAETNPRIYSRRRTSWESKPKERFSGDMIQIDGYSIPAEYETEARRNFDRFKRDIMAIPSLALEPYFKNMGLVKSCISAEMADPYRDGRLAEWFKGKDEFSYFIHVDLSLTTDATGISMVHRQGEQIIADLILKIHPGANGIDLAAIKNMILEIKTRGFYIFKCTFDQFQSASSIQELNRWGIPSEVLSVDKTLAPYETLKEILYTGKLKMYLNEELLSELQRLELIQGKKVDHPVKSSKDVADSLAGAVFSCVTANNFFSFGAAGGINADGSSRRNAVMKTEAELMKEAETQTADTLVPYGYYRGRRL